MGRPKNRSQDAKWAVELINHDIYFLNLKCTTVDNLIQQDMSNAVYLN